ncbi:MAG TPA: hypothetical protein VES39_11610 [Rhodospirillales bacterium]|nr:hypothetical protein [Rhodospirillales bacterium]
MAAIPLGMVVEVPKDATMTDLSKSWVRFRTLPDDVLDDMPEHVRSTFLAARRSGFEVEMLCSGARPPAERRAPRRFVLVADDVGDAGSGGPLAFDLAAVAADVRLSNRLFVIATQARADIYAAAYAAAVEDLSCGYAVSVVVETRAPFAEAWARTLAALRDGAIPGSLSVAAEPGVVAVPAAARRSRRKRAC